MQSKVTHRWDTPALVSSWQSFPPLPSCPLHPFSCPQWLLLVPKLKWSITVSSGHTPDSGSAFRLQDNLVRRSHHCHPDITNEPREGQDGQAVACPGSSQPLEAASGPAQGGGTPDPGSPSFPLLTLRKQQEYSHPPKLSVRREGSWGDGLDPVELQATAETEHRSLRPGHPSPGCCLLGSPTNQTVCPSCPAPIHYGIGGLTKAEQRGCCDVSDIIPGCHG